MKAGLSCISASEARRRLAELGTSLAVEEVSLAQAAGRVLARELRASEPIPAFPRSAMDGFAVRAADVAVAIPAAPVTLRLGGRVAMGEPAGVRVGCGEACAVSTGAHLPPGADAVVMVEDTAETSDGQVQVFRSVDSGRNVIAVGDDLAAGSVVLPTGRRLGEGEVAALAAFGMDRLDVFRRLRVAVLSTGAELRAVSDRPGPGQVRDVNQHALAAAVEATGALATRAGIAPEDAAALAGRLDLLLAEHEVIIVSGGSSVGSKDFTAEAIGRLGARLLFHGIDVRPGRPTLAAQRGDRTVFGLPGVPAAALTIFQVLVQPVLRRLQGETADGLPTPWLPARLDRELTSRAGREDYVRVRLRADGEELSACPLPGPNALATIVQADGLIVVPETAEKLPAGAPVRVLRK